MTKNPIILHYVLEITNYIVCSGACTTKDALFSAKGGQFLMSVNSAFGAKNVAPILKSLSSFMLAAA